MRLDGRCVLRSPTAFSTNELGFRSYHSLPYLVRTAAIPSESCLHYHSRLDHLINRSPKRAGTNLNPLFGSIRSNGCGSTNIDYIARQLQITIIRSTRTVQPASTKSYVDDPNTLYRPAASVWACKFRRSDKIDGLFTLA